MVDGILSNLFGKAIRRAFQEIVVIDNQGDAIEKMQPLNIIDFRSDRKAGLSGKGFVSCEFHK